MSNYYKIKFFNTSNGPGIRTSIFFTGCELKCPGCFNEELWDKNSGKIFDKTTYKEIADSINKHIAGISILGGEPLADFNLEAIEFLTTSFNKDFPDKNIWLWSGYTWDKIITKVPLKVLNQISVIVDGPFIEANKVPNLKWRGSTNQRVIDVKKSLEQNKVILYEE